LRAVIPTTPELILLVILALLVCNTAGGLARGLAGGLALATATVFNSLCNILRFNSLNSRHGKALRLDELLITLSFYHKKHVVSIFFAYFE
jgi:hypothetical protein